MVVRRTHTHTLERTDKDSKSNPRPAHTARWPWVAFGFDGARGGALAAARVVAVGLWLKQSASRDASASNQGLLKIRCEHESRCRAVESARSQQLFRQRETCASESNIRQCDATCRFV